MRRQFKLQIVSVNPQLRIPVSADSEYMRELMFANLRRMVMIDCLDPMLGHNHLDPDFATSWMSECGMDAIEQEFMVTRMSECPCNFCGSGRAGPGFDLEESWHVHWKSVQGRWTSVGVLSRSASDAAGGPPTDVVRTWDHADLVTDADYDRSMCMVIDDALHDAALIGSMTDDRLRGLIITNVEKVVYAYAPVAVAVAVDNIQVNLHGVGAHVEASVDLALASGGQISHIRTSRTMDCTPHA